MNIEEFKKILNKHLSILDSFIDNKIEIDDDIIDNLLKDIELIKKIDFKDLSHKDIDKINENVSSIIRKIEYLKQKTFKDIYSLNNKSEVIRKYFKY